jgi:hypothetical protein
VLFRLWILGGLGCDHEGVGGGIGCLAGGRMKLKKKSETMVSTLKTPRRYKNEQLVLKKVVVATQKN